jgi:hypothetical protein
MQRLALVLTLFLLCLTALHAQAPLSYCSNPDEEEGINQEEAAESFSGMKLSLHLGHISR